MTIRCTYCGAEVPGPEPFCSEQHKEFLARTRRYDLAQMEHFAAERRKAAGLTNGKEPE